MVIKYEVSKSEKQQLEIEDTKNVFLQGINPYAALPTYFGIWNNKNGLVIVTITSWKNISYKCYLENSISTQLDIKNFLQHNKNVKIITKNEFKEQIEFITKLFKI